MKTETTPDLVHGDGRLLYENPAWYDAMFPDPELDKARFLEALIRRFGGGRRLLDVGCGTGRELGYLVPRGFDGMGIDAVPAMVEYARARVPNGRFVVGRMEELDLGERFDVVTCCGSALLQCWTNEAVLETLRRFRRHLHDGGLLLLDQRNGAYFLGGADAAAWLARDGHSTAVLDGQALRAVARHSIDHERQLLTRIREWHVPGRAEPLVERTAWRLLMPKELDFFLAQAGFEIVAMFDHPTPYVEGWSRHPLWAPDGPVPTGMRDRQAVVVARAGAPSP